VRRFGLFDDPVDALSPRVATEVRRTEVTARRGHGIAELVLTNPAGAD
jgi:hypothetical protein